VCASTWEFRFQSLMFACKHAPGTTYSSLHSCNYTIKCTFMHECILHKYTYEYIQTYTYIHTRIHFQWFAYRFERDKSLNWSNFRCLRAMSDVKLMGPVCMSSLFFFAFLWIDVLFNGTLFIGTLQKANCQMMNNLRVLFLTILLEIFVPVGRQKKRASANCKNGTR
jgi:hypothetical protein